MTPYRIVQQFIAHHWGPYETTFPPRKRANRPTPVFWRQPDATLFLAPRHSGRLCLQQRLVLVAEMPSAYHRGAARV